MTTVHAYRRVTAKFALRSHDFALLDGVFALSLQSVFTVRSRHYTGIAQNLPKNGVSSNHAARTVQNLLSDAMPIVFRALRQFGQLGGSV